MKIFQTREVTVLMGPVEHTGNRRADERAAVARLMLEAFPDGATRLGHLPTGAPTLEGPGASEYASVSVSHCSDYALLALSRRTAIGIDIERERPQLRRVVEKFLTPAEAEVYNTDQLLLRAWTATEAIYKAALTPGLHLAEGIRLPAPDFHDAAIADRKKFCLTAIDAPQGHAITLALGII